MLHDAYRGPHRYTARFDEGEHARARILEKCVSYLPQIRDPLTRSVEKLQDSRYGNDMDINAMLDSFERHTKPTFKESSQRSYIKFGSMRDTDLAVGIRSGQLALEAYAMVIPFKPMSRAEPCFRRDVTRCFQPSLDGILQAIKAQHASASASVGVSSTPCRLLKLNSDSGLARALPRLLSLLEGLPQVHGYMTG